jgi:dipeptidase E
MKIKYLFSGINEEDGLVDEIVPFLQSDIKGGKIVFIPTDFNDNDKNQQFLDLDLRIFNDIGINFDKAIIIDSRMNKELAKEEVETADVIFLWGGNTEEQIRNIKEYDLIPSLQRRDGVTIGISAGSINMSDDVVLVRYDKETLFYKGIGLVDINVDPHFSFEDEKYIQNNLLPSSYGKKLICLTDESIIRVSEINEIMYFGNCYEIKDGNIKLIDYNIDQYSK